MAGILLYVKIYRTDVMQDVGMVTRFQENPKETHVQAIKRIFRYLKITLDFKLRYPKNESFSFTTYSDAN